MIIFKFLLLGFFTALLFPPFFILPLGFVIFPFLYKLILKLHLTNSFKLFFFSGFVYAIGLFSIYLIWIQNPFYIYEIDQCENPDLDSSQCDILLHRPRPVANLSEPCRLHLKELLEHLEEAEIPYHLNPYLFPESGKHAETVYKIIDLDTSEVVAYGERFSTRAKKHLQVKADEIIHCAAITVQVSGGKTEKYQEVSAEDELSKYNVYFAHSGSIAKKNTLRVLEMLHDAGINVKHSVIKNTLREQLYHSEKYQFPITVILGVKEVQDGTIIVRNNQANRQKAIPLNRMCSYIKRYL
mgnify:CR=1 FL=1